MSILSSRYRCQTWEECEYLSPLLPPPARKPTLLELYHVVPVDVFALAEHYGILIRTRPLPDRVCAVLHSFDGDRSYLYLNANHCIERQRFTVAHEIGHHIMSRCDREADRPQRPRTIADEINNDSFAAQILAPGFDVSCMLQEGLSVDEMAKRFVMSRQAMKMRIKEVIKEERERVARGRSSPLAHLVAGNGE